MNVQFKNLAIRSGLFVLMSITLIACGNTDTNKETDKRSENTTTEEVVEVETSAAPDVSFKDKDGNKISLTSLKGKVVFINFWATWCPPCIHEMPSINELRQIFKGNDNIEFLMVDVDNKIEQSTTFMEENKYDLPVYTPASNIPSDFLGGSIPTTVVLDKSGNMAARLEGGRDYTAPEIVKALNELVASN